VEPISLWLVLLAGWALTHFWLLPVTTSAWKAKSTREKMARAGTLAVIKNLRDVCAVGSATVAIILLWLIVLSAFARSNATLPRVLIGWLAGFYETAKSFAENYATGTAILGVAGMATVLYLGARQARARVAEAWGERATIVFARLRDDTDELNQVLAEESMQPHAQEIARLVALLNETPDDARREPLHRQLSSVLSAVAVEVASREVKFEEKLDEPAQGPAPGGALGRIARLLGSSRFHEDVGLVKKRLGYIVTGLLFVSLIGWSAEPMANSLQLAVNNLRINQAHDDASRDMQSAMSQVVISVPKASSQTSQVPSAAAVRSVTQSLARAATHELLRAPLVNASAGVHQGGSENEFVRAAITGDQIEAGTDAGAEVRVRSEVAHEVADGGKAPSGVRRAQEHAEALLQPHVETLGHDHPNVFWRLKAALEARYDEVLSPYEAQGKLTERIIDELFAGTDFHPAGELGKQGQKLVKEFGKKAAQTWVDTVLEQYMTDAIVTAARGDVRDRSPFAFETSDEAHRFVASLQAATDLGWSGTPSERADQKMSEAVAHEIASHYADEPGLRESIAHPLSGYDQIFPRQDQVALVTDMNGSDSPAAGPVDNSGGGGGTKAAATAEQGVVREGAPSVRAPAARVAMRSVATEFRMASLSFRVRGVLVGQPMSGADPGISDLRWQVLAARPGEPTRVRIEVLTAASVWVDIGSFDAAVVNQALRYAADRRVVATTITPGDGKIVGRVTYLHPALVNTPLGCRIVESDRLIDTFTMSTRLAAPASALGQLERDRRATEQWIHRVSIAERVAADSSCPTQALDRAFAHSPASGVAFSPALQREMDRFVATQDKTHPGSVDFLRQADACAKGPTGALAACVCTISKSSVNSGPYWMPEDHTSQFRERTARLAPDLSWLRRSPDRLANVDLWVHTTFSMHRPSATGEPQVDEGSAAEVAFPGVELDALRQLSGAVLPMYVAQELRSPSYDDFTGPVEDFILLQRLMRAALDGQLGSGFPARKLIDLERATRAAVPYQPTIRWEPTQGDPKALRVSLGSADADAAKSYEAWRSDVETRLRTGQPTCGAVSK
jgi:hypothetical protein